jgi:uncharacterized phage-associated protein
MFETNESVAFSHDLDVRTVADYFIQQDALREEPDVTPMKLQKLLYFAQANFLASTGERLFDENIEAYEHGPVVHREWQRHPGRQIIAELPEASYASDMVVPTDIESFLDQVWLRYKDCSAMTLRNLTHRQDPWKHHYDTNSYRAVIPDADMAEFFRHKVPVVDRIFHQSVVLVPEGFLGDVDDDEVAEKLAAFLRQ